MDDQTLNVFTAFVHLTDEAGHHHAFGPGDPVPGWARPLVGDHVLAESQTYQPVAEPVDPQVDVVAQAPGYTAFGDEAFGDGADDDGSGGKPKPPPTSGPGSNRPAWAEFATAVGQPVAPNQSRQDIIDALIRHGHLRE